MVLCVVNFPNMNYTQFIVLSEASIGSGLSRTSFPLDAGIAHSKTGLILQKPQSNFSSFTLRWCKNDVQYSYHLNVLLCRGNVEVILKAGRGN